MNNIELDNISRSIIVNDLNSNLFVEASAGSGKTTLLVERVIKLIEGDINNPPTPINKICCITFTKKAANEFYERLSKRLDERSRGAKNKSNSFLDEPNNNTMALCKTALDNIDLAFMGTIDAFCNKILKEYPLNANVPYSSDVIEDDDKKDSIFIREFEKSLNGVYGLDLQSKAKEIVLRFNKPIDAIKSSYSSIFNNRHFNIVYNKPDNSYLKSKYKIIDELKEELVSFYDDLETIVLKGINPFDFEIRKNKFFNKERAAIINFKDDLIKDTYYLNISKYTYIFKRIKVDMGKIFAKMLPEYFDDDSDKKYIRCIELIYDELLNINHAFLMDYIVSSIPYVESTLKKNGELSFIDNLLYLKDMLEKDAFDGGTLIKTISNKYSKFLIDEYQDTNPIQINIFIYLASKEIYKDIYKCVINDGALFVVGDPKQSIYRFSGADISSYINIKNYFSKLKNGKVVALERNFRSNTDILNYVNNKFSELLIDKEPMQVKFTSVPIIKDNRDDESLFKGIYNFSGSIKDVPRIIKELVNNKKYQIVDKYGENKRLIEYKDFMILYAKKNKLFEATTALKDFNIPYVVEGLVDYKDSDSFRDIVSIYSYLIDSSFENTLKLLTSSLFKFDSDNLLYIKNNYSFDNILDNVDFINHYKISEKSLKLNELKNDLIKEEPSSFILSIIEKLELFKYIDSFDLDLLIYIIEVIKSKEESGLITSHFECLTYLYDLIENNIKLERNANLSKEINSCYIGNIHKVKGLEAPIVILVEDTRTEKEPSYKADRINNNFYFFNAKTSGIIRSLISKTNEYDNELIDESSFTEHEYKRLLYVAVTRARCALLINNKDKGECFKELLYVKEDGEIVNNKELIIDNTINNSLNDSLSVNPYDGYKSNISNLNNLLTESYKLFNPSVEAHNDQNDNIVLESNKPKTVNTKSTLKGTIVHESLEVVVNSKGKVDINKLSKYICNKYEYIEFESKLIDILNTFIETGFDQETSVPKHLFNELIDAKEVFTETPFTYLKDNVLYNGIIDLIYIDKNDEYHLIDYKTNRKSTDLDELYKVQLDAYENAVTSIDKTIKIKDKYIYHICC